MPGYSAEKSLSELDRKWMATFMSECQGEDVAYAKWLDALLKEISGEVELLPFSHDVEASEFSASRIYAGSAGKLVSRTSIRILNPPPPGICPSDRKYSSLHADIELARPRDQDAPNLLWSNVRSHQSDARIEADFQSRNHDVD
jgi:hypothetical protein